MRFKHFRIKVPCNRGPDAWVTVVADAGLFWVTRARWQDVGLKGYVRWCPIMGVILTHKGTGGKVGWFPSVETALVAADKFNEIIGEDVLGSLKEPNYKHEAGHALVVKFRRLYWEGEEVTP